MTNRNGMPMIPVKIRNSSAGVGKLVAVAVGTLKPGDIRIHKNANTLTVNSGDGSIINSGVPLQQNGAIWMSNVESDDMRAGALPIDHTDAQGLLQQLRDLRIVGYNWKTDGQNATKRPGVTADDMQSAFPNLVDGDDFVSASELIPISILAMQSILNATPQGPEGPKCDNGDRNDRGADGAQGPKGDRGDKGDRDDRGSSWGTGTQR